MIQIIPAISIYGLKVARLHHHDLNDVVMYEEMPLDLAIKFEQHGIKRVHIIDLEGAKKGRVVNVDVIEMIKGYTNLEVDFGGGISEDDDIRIAFEYGASSVHAATIAATNRELFSSWIISYGGNRIMLSADCINGKISTKGWTKNTDIDIKDHIRYYYEQGVQMVKVTDIGLDGKLEGPAFDLYKELIQEFPDIKLIASGGVRSVEDIDRLQDIGVYSVIFAKAMYEGKIKLEELGRFLA
ncbi:MAG: HisA/HisF-related TIM barrel protein [Cytophagaceae bacterium]